MANLQNAAVIRGFAMKGRNDDEEEEAAEQKARRGATS